MSRMLFNEKFQQLKTPNFELIHRLEFSFGLRILQDSNSNAFMSTFRLIHQLLYSLYSLFLFTIRDPKISFYFGDAISFYGGKSYVFNLVVSAFLLFDVCTRIFGRV